MLKFKETFGWFFHYNNSLNIEGYLFGLPKRERR